MSCCCLSKVESQVLLMACACGDVCWALLSLTGFLGCEKLWRFLSHSYSILSIGSAALRWPHKRIAAVRRQILSSSWPSSTEVPQCRLWKESVDVNGNCSMEQTPLALWGPRGTQWEWGARHCAQCARGFACLPLNTGIAPIKVNLCSGGAL